MYGKLEKVTEHLLAKLYPSNLVNIVSFTGPESINHFGFSNLIAYHVN